jgi:hypothetical protein
LWLNKNQMGMLVRLTYYGTNKGTLINLDNVHNIYQVFDKINRRLVTKVCFNVNNYINVEETPQEILKLQQSFMKGEYQETDWDTPQTFDDQIESEYYNSTPERRTTYPLRRGKPSQFEIYNDNQY